MNQLDNSSLGNLVPTIEGQQAFVPHNLPHQVDLNPPLIYLLDKASRAVATLSGIGETIPNPHLLIRPFVRREAVLSSRIEGTQASISDLYLFEASRKRKPVKDVVEVINYVHALEQGIQFLEDIPISFRLINNVHDILMRRVRGSEPRPGEIRTTQVWIGQPGSPIQDARYIPPPAAYIRDLMFDLESFVNADIEMPPLIQCALMHYQIEAIHPYLDGNGRIGRLLIPLFLSAKNVLPKPLLYLSAYFERERDEYYDELFNVSKTGDWSPWLRYFLQGIEEQSHDALLRTRRVRELQEQYRTLLQNRRESGNTLSLLDHLFESPYLTAPTAADFLEVTVAGARRILERLADAGIVEVDSNSWPHNYIARDLLRVIEAPTASEEDVPN